MSTGIGYALALTLFSGFLFGLLPALRQRAHDLVRALKE